MRMLRVLKCSIVRLEIGEPQLTNNQNKDFQPIFYKGTTFANCEEAMYVLSFNNCMLMDDLFGNWSTKANCDALVAKKLDDKICVDSNDNELYKEVRLKMNYTKKVRLTMSKINCILRVDVQMIFCHLTNIPMTYQGFRTILWPTSVLQLNAYMMIL